jgi:hypothetical protein
MTAALPDPAFHNYIDRHRLATKLAALHWQRVGVGLSGAALAMGYNLYRAPGLATPAPWVSLSVGVLFAVGCSVVALVVRQRLKHLLGRTGEGAREQALAVADYVNGWGNHLLLLAALGHAVLVAETVFSVRLGPTASGAGALLLLLPSAALLLHGLLRIPDDRRLVALHQRISSAPAAT